MAKKPPTHGNVRRGSTYVQQFLLVKGTRKFTDRKKARNKKACRQRNTPLSRKGYSTLLT